MTRWPASRRPQSISTREASVDSARFPDPSRMMLDVPTFTTMVRRASTPAIAVYFLLEPRLAEIASDA